MKKQQAEARQMCRHTIVYTEVDDIDVVVMALQGMSTKAIAQTVGMTEAKAQYRITKAQKSLNTKFRWNYRNCAGTLAYRMQEQTHSMVAHYVKTQVAPKFIRFAKRGVPRM